MLVWGQGNTDRYLCGTVLCTIIMVRAVLTGRLTELGCGLGWFNFLFLSTCIFYSIPFSELSLV